MKKYEFTGETKVVDGIALHRIRRLSDGAIGGWIESEANLSHEESCWIFDNAAISGGARIFGNAVVFDNAEVFGDARVFGGAVISDDAAISDNARIFGNARIFDNAVVFGTAWIFGRAVVSDDARVPCDARVSGDARVMCPLDIASVSGPRHALHCTNAGISVGCELHSLATWEEKYKEIGIKRGYTEAEQEHYITLIRVVQKMYEDQQGLKGSI